MAKTMTPAESHPSSTSLGPLLRAVFSDLGHANICYCLLRGYNDLRHATSDGDVDVLVAPADFEPMRDVLKPLGFVPLSRWGQYPHHFFVAYDKHQDVWIKLDVMAELSYGYPIPALQTTLAPHALARRKQNDGVPVLSAEDELLTLLLHCLLDKAVFKPAYRDRLRELVEAVTDERYLVGTIGALFPPAISWPVIQQAILADKWDILLAMRSSVARRLAQRNPVGTYLRRWIRFGQRFLDRRTRNWRISGMTVALLAPDGAGKTTLAHALKDGFILPVRYVYMGTNTGSNTLTLPTTRWLTARRIHNSNRITRILSAVNSLLQQGLRYRVGAYHRRRGRLVVFDRYSTRALTSGRQATSMLKRLQHWLLRKVSPAPDLVLYLDAPAEVLYERKQEHTIASLHVQRERFMRLLRGIPHVMIVDAAQNADAVRRDVIAKIWHRYASTKRCA